MPVCREHGTAFGQCASELLKQCACWNSSRAVAPLEVSDDVEDEHLAPAEPGAPERAGDLVHRCHDDRSVKNQSLLLRRQQHLSLTGYAKLSEFASAALTLHFRPRVTEHPELL